MREAPTMDTIVSLAKRRGFVFAGSEIYGGLANTWDYGPLGVELKRNIERLWWKRFVHDRADMVGIDAAILMHPKVWEASGHVAGFNDALVDCKSCKTRHRADHLIEAQTSERVEGKSAPELTALLSAHNVKCPICGKSDFTEVRKFNLLFRTHIGPVEDQSSAVYLRGETAQAMFVNFKNILNSTRQKIPFGIAQIGKSFRNEITPGNFIFRTLEFTQAEIEYFIKPTEWEKSFDEWQRGMEEWLIGLGVEDEHFRIREHSKEELSHYSKRTIDIEYNFPFGWKELYGLAYRTDFDLANHQRVSGQDLTYFDSETNERYLPHVIEPTFGIDRTFLILLLDAYHEEEAPTAEEGETETRVVLRLHKELAPIKVAILPLSKKPELSKVARSIFDELKQHFVCEYDETQSIGKRYRRQDEIGTPYCVTVDFDSLNDNAVTVRERDSMKQERI
ncbi:MAG: glycine--tRNA ligase, partial [Parcubacteria group bacterium]|nr:glycine--tRNA ligase [Parcubacteria group bacterium]